MSLLVFFAVLAAAAMHAIWNALVKVHLDRFLSITLMTLGMGGAALVALPFVKFPKAEVWPYIVASVIFHMGYRTFLIGAYKAGDFAQTYPLARGTAPLLAALGGIVVVAEVPAPLAIVGIVLLSAGTQALPLLARDWKAGVYTGVLSGAAYWIVMWAMTKAPIASVAALRETSILFAMMISVFALGEKMTGWRGAAVLSIVAGVVALRLG